MWQKDKGVSWDASRSCWMDCCQDTTGDYQPRIDVPCTKLRPKLQVTLRQSAQKLPDTPIKHIYAPHHALVTTPTLHSTSPTTHAFSQELVSHHQMPPVSIIVRKMPPPPPPFSSLPLATTPHLTPLQTPSPPPATLNSSEDVFEDDKTDFFSVLRSFEPVDSPQQISPEPTPRSELEEKPLSRVPLTVSIISQQSRKLQTLYSISEAHSDMENSRGDSVKNMPYF